MTKKKIKTKSKVTPLYVFKKRLLKLADFLDKLPRERFNYAEWVGDDWQGKPNLSCGTKGCALGWSTTIPSFRKLGLELRLPKRALDGGGYVTMKHLKDDDFDASFRASEIVFGLNEDEFEELFIPNDLFNDGKNSLPISATPKQVAKHIRNFVTNKYPKRSK